MVRSVRSRKRSKTLCVDPGRPPFIVFTRRPRSNRRKAQETEIDDELSEEIIDVSHAPARAPRAKRAVAKTPKVIDIDMDKDVSLTAFASDRDDSSQAKKYMIAAAWLKEHRGIDAINENHIYTCFKKMDWSTNIPNFAQPLRDLKAKQSFFEKSDKGYEINHIGIDFVKKLKRKGE